MSDCTVSFSTLGLYRQGNWSVPLGSVPGTVWGQVPETSGKSRPDFCVIPNARGTDWTFPRDTRDKPTGRLRSKSGGVPTIIELFYLYWFSSLPSSVSARSSRCVIVPSSQLPRRRRYSLFNSPLGCGAQNEEI